MGRLEGRVSALEARKGVHDIYKYPWHRIMVREGQSDAEAVDAYGRDKIGPNDNIIAVRIVSPKFDADGKMIPQPKSENGSRSGIGPMGFGGLGGGDGTA